MENLFSGKTNLIPIINDVLNYIFTKGLLSHALTQHSFDIPGYLTKLAEQDRINMKKYLLQKSKKMDPKAALTNLIVKGGCSLNFVATDETLRAIFEQYLNFEIPHFAEVRSMIIERSKVSIEIIRDQIAKRIAKGERPSAEFDEWTSIAQKQLIGIILNFHDETYHLGIQEVEADSCNAEAIVAMLRIKLNEFGLKMDDIHYFVADGASVNGLVSKMTGFEIQKCQNHGLHLGNSFSFIVTSY